MKNNFICSKCKQERYISSYTISYEDKDKKIYKLLKGSKRTIECSDCKLPMDYIKSKSKWKLEDVPNIGIFSMKSLAQKQDYLINRSKIHSQKTCQPHQEDMSVLKNKLKNKK